MCAGSAHRNFEDNLKPEYVVDFSPLTKEEMEAALKTDPVKFVEGFQLTYRRLDSQHSFGKVMPT